MSKKELAEKAKSELIGKKVLHMNHLIPVNNVRYLNDGLILIYSTNNWCCNIDILRTKEGYPVVQALEEGRQIP